MTPGIERLRLSPVCELEYNLHPLAELRDYYKLLHQGVFGPGHLLLDLDLAKQYLLWEAKSPVCNREPILQDIGLIVPLFRVSLNAIGMFGLDFDTYFSGFAASAKRFGGLSQKEWQAIWASAEEMLNPAGTGVGWFRSRQTSFSGQSADLRHLSGTSIEPISHSPHYRETYKPHYRLIEAGIIRSWGQDWAMMVERETIA